jgi:hypothetical protein
MGLLKAAYLEPYLFLLGFKTRRLFYLKKDPGEHKDVKGNERDTAQKLQGYIEALNKAASQATGARSASEGSAAEEEKKIEAHLAALGYVED